MLNSAKVKLHRALWRVGYDIRRVPPSSAGDPAEPSRESRSLPDYRYADFDEAVRRLCDYVTPYTMTSPERIYALRAGVEYVVRNSIPGDFVECGVWKGGSMMAVARTLLDTGITDRKLYLFDTFEGMTPPTERDKDFQGGTAADILKREDRDSSIYWGCCPLEHVRRNLERTGYSTEQMTFIKGRVEQTIPENAPDTIAFLRLDTDWYESTYHELRHLYPRLSPGGVLIIDDYGHWAGARSAVDQYVTENKLPLLLDRIDYSGRICIKPWR